GGDRRARRRRERRSPERVLDERVEEVPALAVGAVAALRPRPQLAEARRERDVLLADAAAQLVAEPLGERRRSSARGDGERDRVAPEDGGQDEAEVLRRVDDVAQQRARLGVLED